MPRRNWRPVSEDVLAKLNGYYECPLDCPVHERMVQMFGVLTTDLVEEHRTNNKKVPLIHQMVDGWHMRALIGDFLSYAGEAIKTNRINEWPRLEQEYTKDQTGFTGLVLGCLADFCFNMEYVRRITDHRWAYCDKEGHPRLYYPYLGVCPRCILKVANPQDAILNFHGEANGDVSEDEVEDRARYFGNKIKSHHVGRIGERILTFILDLIARSFDSGATSALIIDDQHDVDTVFFSNGIATLAQIKSSPLVLLPVVSNLPTPLTLGTSPETGLPLPRPNHTFTDLPTATADLALYFALDDSTLPLGSNTKGHWPYNALRKQLTLDVVMKLLDNWIAIFRSFEIPKRERTGDDVKRAYLTSGWGAPIDDNKTKAGLARSDNMMKGTYACLKYGAYYVQECINGTVRAALTSNIDPAHQYQDYLQKLEDIRWGHDTNFNPVKAEDDGEVVAYTITPQNLTYLFDSVFTFNRQILNDDHLRQIWNLQDFGIKLASGELAPLLDKWRQLPERVLQDDLQQLQLLDFEDSDGGKKPRRKKK